MSFGLSEKTLGIVRQIFSDYPQIEKVLLYGSRAKGNYKEGSDIDVTLVGDGLNYSLLSNLAEAFAESSIPYTVDVSLLDNIDNPDLREHIERVGIVLYERGKSYSPTSFQRSIT